MSMSEKRASALLSVKGIAIKMQPTGSRVICNPAPTDTDEDWLVLLDAHGPRDMDLMFGTPPGEGRYAESTAEPAPMGFRAYRAGQLNFITTRSADFYDRFAAATQVAKRLNLLRKNDRVALFQAVLYGNGGDL